MTQGMRGGQGKVKQGGEMAKKIYGLSTSRSLWNPDSTLEISEEPCRRHLMIAWELKGGVIPPTSLLQDKAYAAGL